ALSGGNAVHADVHVGLAGGIAEGQVAVVDPQPAQLQVGAAAIVLGQEVPVAALFALLQAEHRPVQPHQGNAHAAREQRLDRDVDRDPLGFRHVFVARPVGVAEAHVAGGHGGGPAEVHVEV